jgi:hypothetical protein
LFGDNGATKVGRMLGGDTAVLADGRDQGGGCTESDPPEERAGRFQQMG